MPVHAKRPGCYSKGGKVHDDEKPARGLHDTKETGVHGTYSVGLGYPGGDRGVSMAGHAARSGHQWATQEHRRVLNEMKADKTDRRNLAEGGDVEPFHDDGVEEQSKGMPVTDPMDENESGESEIGDALVDELMTAMEHKDHKQVREAIEALVMNCLSKGGQDV